MHGSRPAAPEREPLAEPAIAPAPDLDPAVLAAVDLGSNSFHLIVARMIDGQLLVIDRLREVVRLAAGLDERRNLSEEAMQRALACLERFGQRLRDMPTAAVRAVGTNTLRSAHNGESFRLAAQRKLGHPIEVIAGREEARLIYLGVAHALETDRSRRLVVDIGGGSTELIIGQDFDAVYRESLYMGCVSMSRDHFADGRIDKLAMKRAELAARVELEPIQSRFRAAAWDSVVGSSGTMRAVAAVVQSAGWCKYGITRSALRKLRRALVDAGRVEALNLKDLKDERKPVFPGGVAILYAIFEALDIEQLMVSDMALREGLLYDLLGRIRHRDVRERSVVRLAEQYGVDPEQRVRVERTALACLGQVSSGWEMRDDVHRAMLSWAAKLHEVGLAVSHNQYHKHGAYLIEHTDLAGFSRQEQLVLASLIRGHRRKFPAAVFERLYAPASSEAKRLCLLLRLAVVLHRGRSDSQVPRIEVAADGERIRLRFPEGWLDSHPLTCADLVQERDYLAAAGMSLDFA